MEQFEIIVKTLAGLEEVLEKEVTDLGGKEVQRLTRAVRFIGDKELLYKSNLQLRTALSVLKVIDTSTTYDEGRLYRNIKRLPWEKYFRINETFAIDGVTSGTVFTHSKYVALKSKDAIADRFREKFGKRPSVDTQNPDLRINIHIQDRKCTVSLDSSGDTLSRRGYKQAQTEAPLSEVLAAGMLRMTGWRGEENFLDPMCGSGTIAIEAALIARNIAPGNFRRFNFQKWEDYDENLWKTLKEKAKNDEVDFHGQIVASDKNPEAVQATRKNAKAAGVEDIIKCERQDFFKIEGIKNALIMMNPPYGERLEKDIDIIQFYEEIGTRLKHNFSGNDAWIFSANLQALKRVGLRPSRKVPLYNGPLEARLNKYELYQGSKKTDNQE